MPTDTKDPEQLFDPRDPRLQQGRYLYDAQVVLARLEKGETIEPEAIKLLGERYCELIGVTGQLRAECHRLTEKDKKRKRTVLEAVRDLQRLEDPPPPKTVEDDE